MADDLSARMWAAVVTLLGEANLAMADEVLRHGRTYRDIGRDRGLAASTVHARVMRVRGVLAQHGLEPRSWKRSAVAEQNLQLP